jgi:diguanylate cyclase (GGDEF)-like protein/PAS domain S-box-containing protein
LRVYRLLSSIAGATPVLFWGEVKTRSVVNRKVQFAFGAAILALIAVGTISYRAVIASSESDGRVQHTYEVLANLNRLLAVVESLESGYRGFALTGEESYLQSYRSSAENAVQAENAVRNLTMDNLGQRQRLPALERLIAEKIQFGDLVMDIRRTRGLAAASDTLRNGAGSQLMSEIQGQARAMQDEELRLLALRNSDAKLRTEQTRELLFFGTLLGILIAAGAGWIAHRGESAREVAEAGRREGEDALRLSEERLTLLIQGVRDYAIFMLDPAGLVVTWNEGAERIKGYAAAEIIGQHFSKFYTPEAVAQGTPARELKTAEEQGYSEEEGWRVRKDGSRFLANVVITALRDKAGHLRGFGKVVRDITSRNEAESRVESLSTRLSIATEAAEMGVWEWDPATNVVICNETMDRIYGYSPTVSTPSGGWLVQTRYERFAAAIHPEDLPDVEAKLQQVIAQKSQGATEYRIILPDGSIRNISAVERAILDESGNVTRLVGVNTDITDRQAAEDELFAEKERAQVTLNSIGDAVVCTDLAGNVSFLNPVAEKMTGWPQEEATGQPVAEVLQILDNTTRRAVPNPMERAVVENSTMNLPSNCYLIRRDGEETPIEDSVSPIHDRRGQVTGAVIVFRDVTAAQAMARQMAYSAQHDFLTGLPNRMLLNDRVDQAIVMAARHNGRVAVLFLDLDGFKHINDSLGHPIGDRLLQSVAGRLRECLRGSDTVSRLGGDEFVVLLSEVQRAEDAAYTAQRIIQAIAAPHSIDGHDLHVTASIGISAYPDDGLDGATLIKNADTAMYHAKDHGRESFEFFKQAMNVRAVARQSIEAGLRRALERQEFVVHYQPKVDLTTGAITGAEALIRWAHPSRGMVPPAEFIPVAEDCGLILPIGNWVLRESCRQARAWLDAGLPLKAIAVNVSAMEFRDKHFGEGVLKALDDAGLHPRHLQLELTEGILMKNADSTESILNTLRARGVQVAIDDFGTGYSSLSYLTRFPIDILKIDQSFVHQIAASEGDTPLVIAIISMGRSLNMQVVAEGVEKQEEMAFLQAHQCDEAQGYYFGRPVVGEQFATLLRTGIPKAVSTLDCGVLDPLPGAFRNVAIRDDLDASGVEGTG